MFVPNAKSDALIDFQTLYNISHARQFQKKNCGQNLLIAHLDHSVKLLNKFIVLSKPISPMYVLFDRFP